MASIQGHFDPWHPRLLERTEAQLDLILEAYSVDHPKELKFERRKTREARERPLDILKGWADVLIGTAKDQLVSQVSFKIPPRFGPKLTGSSQSPPSAAALRSSFIPRKSTVPPAAPRAAPRRK